MDPRVATEADVPSWLALARVVEPLFGPMPDIEDYLRRGAERGTAIVIGPPGDVHAGMLLSRDGRPHHINWLATDPRHRCSGLGSALVRHALDRWPDGTVEVITFTAEEPDGQAARRLYERHGFTEVGAAPPAPDGGARDLYRLTRQTRQPAPLAASVQPFSRPSAGISGSGTSCGS